ncbi:hypothetical protein C8J98_103413 [Luteibacter sp. OK325]|uniref:hypothetical protein n=1 Tax=Luteibacter sp. OK325 TaxID=2135670 RepID=UPI000D3D8629|nr:hypothetical protein [Luteibacter sp. OK325]PTR33650.1 hypothetical protein C8J98_103413 [Luteibacter sp. OK325]
MKTLVLCNPQGREVVAQIDPDRFAEDQFEHYVVTALCAAYSDYHCMTFGGATFIYQGDRRRPDLALVAKDYSHWFVIEVELHSHSFQNHVLPQARCFALGEPEASCATSMAAGLGIERAQAETIVSLVPRAAAVVSNRWSRSWATSLKALTCQMLAVNVFGSSPAAPHLEISGSLSCFEYSIGFGIYNAKDKSIRLSKSVKLSIGTIQIIDNRGFPAMWVSRQTANHLWLSKLEGTPDIPDNSHIQIVRDVSNRFILRIP